jgi:uncharacterized protein YndB with AHSA1/START domain
MPDILHRVGIKATPEKVFAALATIDGLRGWWVSTTTGTPSNDGTIDFGFCDMQVVAAEAGKLVHWRCTRGPSEWLNTEITFQLEWRTDQTFILFKHANWQEPVEFMHHCSTKWASFLFGLMELVERGSGRPVPHDFKIHAGD